MKKTLESERSRNTREPRNAGKTSVITHQRGFPGNPLSTELPAAPNHSKSPSRAAPSLWELGDSMENPACSKLSPWFPGGSREELGLGLRFKLTLGPNPLS